MAIPNYQTFMMPILKRCASGTDLTLRELREDMALEFSLTPDEQKILLPSGSSTILASRVGWAKTYLAKAGLLIQPSRGVVRITPRGREVLEQNPANFGTSYLKRFDDFQEFLGKSNSGEESATLAIASDSSSPSNTPEEALESAHLEIREALASEILDKIKECSPTFFEHLVVDLMVAMGYGGSRRDAGARIGGSGDEGVDGIIKEDRLGLDVIYLQAKKWEGPISRPEIQKFVGALQGKHAKKGVFITTSKFTKEAITYAESIESRVVLIDGATLAQSMVDFNLGVATHAVYEVKRLDSDYFVED